MISDISDTDHPKYDSGLKMLLQLWNINQSKLHTFYYSAIEEKVSTNDRNFIWYVHQKRVKIQNFEMVMFCKISPKFEVLPGQTILLQIYVGCIPFPSGKVS